MKSNKSSQKLPPPSTSMCTRRRRVYKSIFRSSFTSCIKSPPKNHTAKSMKRRKKRKWENFTIILHVQTQTINQWFWYEKKIEGRMVLVVVVGRMSWFWLLSQRVQSRTTRWSWAWWWWWIFSTIVVVSRSGNQLAIERKNVNLKSHLMMKYIHILERKSRDGRGKSTLETHSFVSKRLSS